MPSDRGWTPHDVWRDSFISSASSDPSGCGGGSPRLPLGSRGECWDRLVMSAADGGGVGAGGMLALFLISLRCYPQPHYLDLQTQVCVWLAVSLGELLAGFSWE